MRREELTPLCRKGIRIATLVSDISAISKLGYVGIGEHTQEVLREAGYDEAAISNPIESGAVTACSADDAIRSVILTRGEGTALIA